MAEKTNKKEDSTHVAVIGGGPGGYAAAFRAADLGLEVTLVDTEPNPGGVCLYRGCIPSKALLHVARLIAETRHAGRWGVQFSEPKIDLGKLRGWKESVVTRLTRGLGQLRQQREIEHIQGRASLVDAHTVRIAAGDGKERRLSFENAILATGSRPAAVPALALDSPRVWDSTSALELPAIPETLLVIGGGYIGLELGSVYAALGSRVSLVEMTPRLLSGVDRDLVTILQKRIGKAFASVMLNARVTGMKEVNKGIEVRIEGAGSEPAESVFDNVLVAVGRRPNSERLGLENTKIITNPSGTVRVDAQRRTAEPSIYAIGDLTGEPMLAHKAAHEGIVAAEAIAGNPAAFEPRAIPAVVFTDPEIAWCGLTETQAKEQGREVTVARFPWAASGRAITLDRDDGMTKLIVDPESERILGAGIVGSGAGELIAEGVLAVEMAALASDVALSIHAHPTLSETVMESAEVFFGQSTHVYRPKKKA